MNRKPAGLHWDSVKLEALPKIAEEESRQCTLMLPWRITRYSKEEDMASTPEALTCTASEWVEQRNLPITV